MHKGREIMFNVNIVDDTSVKSVESSKVGDEAVDLRLSMTDSSSAMEYYDCCDYVTNFNS